MTMHDEIDEPDRLKIRYRVGAISRVMLGLLALAPLWGAFGMLRWAWGAPPSWVSVFFTVLGLGAALVGVGILLAAVACKDYVLDVDRHAGTVTCADASSLGHRRRESRPLSQISNLEIGINEWSDSGSDYHLQIHFRNGSMMKFGSASTRVPIDRLLERLARFLAV